MQAYLAKVEKLSYDFIKLVAEALGLPPDGLSHFYDAPDRMQHRGKVAVFLFSIRRVLICMLRS